ncbi:MAG: 50S ribosome-binding GTPase [Synergistaceae bacterium]|nr:50S ribosome-binding GTPase [Synergistaceae bacterium]
MPDDLLTANIVIAGGTGAGKSTLINSVFGKDLARTGSGRPVTGSIVEYSSEGVPVRIWDTVGLELSPETTKKTAEDVKQTILKHNSSDSVMDRIHAIWYCINSGSKRYQEREVEFIKELYSVRVPFMIILTQCIDAKSVLDEFEGKIREINKSECMNDIDVVRVLAQDYSTAVGVVPKFGLDALVDVTMKRLPEFIRSGFAAAQNISMRQKRKEAENILCEAVEETGSGFWNNVKNKVPLVNMLTTEGKIRSVFWKISKVYSSEIPRGEIMQIWEKVFCRIELLKGLTIPFIDFGNFRKQLDNLIISENFDSDDRIGMLSATDQAGIITAYFGYTFIISAENIWKAQSEDKLRKAEYLIDELADKLSAIAGVITKQ